MAKNEMKEMSIETIKNEIVDKLKNNLDILNCLSDHTYTSHNGQMISNIASSIFNYGAEFDDSYISVEAEEHELSFCKSNDHKRYKVIIKIGLEKTKYLDELASMIKKVITELYPNRKKYSNVPFYRKAIRYNTVTHILNRMITFEIETNASMK